MCHDCQTTRCTYFRKSTITILPKFQTMKLTFGGHSGHSAYHVHKGCCRTSIIIINHNNTIKLKCFPLCIRFVYHQKQHEVEKVKKGLQKFYFITKSLYVKTYYHYLTRTFLFLRHVQLFAINQ